VTCPLDGNGKSALVPRREAGLAARLDLAPLLREKATQPGDVLVIHLINAISGKEVRLTTATTGATATATPPIAATAATATATKRAWATTAAAI